MNYMAVILRIRILKNIRRLHAVRPAARCAFCPLCKCDVCIRIRGGEIENLERSLLKVIS